MPAWGCSPSGCRCKVLAAAFGEDLTDMKVAILGSGAVGGYFGGKLAGNHGVTFIARGAHLAAITAWTPDQSAPLAFRRSQAPRKTRRRSGQWFRLYTVKADNPTALPLLTRCSAAQPCSASERVEARVSSDGGGSGTRRTPTSPPRSGARSHRATGTHPPHRVQRGFRRSAAAQRSRPPHSRIFSGADIQSYTAEDGRVPIWGSSCSSRRSPGSPAPRATVGPVWGDPFPGRSSRQLPGIEAVARAEASPSPPTSKASSGHRCDSRDDAVVAALIDLQAGKRISRSAPGHRRPPRRRARRADADHVDALCRPQAARPRSTQVNRALASVQTDISRGAKGGSYR